MKHNKIFALLLFITILASCTKSANDPNENNSETNLKKDNKNGVYDFKKNLGENGVNTQKELTINDRCVGCRKCVIVAPSNFEMDNSTNKAIVTSQEKIDSKEVKQAIDICPVDAIKIG